MNRTRVEGIIRSKISEHEQIHDEHVVEREELIGAIAIGVMEMFAEEFVKLKRVQRELQEIMNRIDASMREVGLHLEEPEDAEPVHSS